MGLVDFMQTLQDQSSEIIYSEEPDQAIRVIPPKKDVIKIIPPEEEKVITQQPTKVKIKFKLPQMDLTAKKTETKPITPVVEENVESKVTQPVKITDIVDDEPKMSEEDTLFLNSGTESSKKSIWMEYYHKAKSSRKQNIIVEKMRIGRFTITPDNKVLILPDYDVVNKDPDEILKDKWF